MKGFFLITDGDAQILPRHTFHTAISGALFSGFVWMLSTSTERPVSL